MSLDQQWVTHLVADALRRGKKSRLWLARVISQLELRPSLVAVQEIAP
jgi:hypothetical protein